MQKFSARKKLGSYPYIGVLFSITLALFVIGLFGLILIYSQELERLVRENVRMQVYLKNELTDTQRIQIEKKLEGLPYINKTVVNEIPVRFISKTEAAKTFIAETGEDFTQFLGENPLHDAYLINIDGAYHSKEAMDKISSEIEKMNGVFQVFYVEGLIESINKNVTRISIILGGLISLLLLTVVLLINNTLRLALFSQRFLIRSMQLVGAKNWFIVKPFLMRSLGYGILAGLLASACIWALLNYANSTIEDLVILQDTNKIMLLMGSLLVIGAFVGCLSTYFSIRKYLKMSLDELY